jgi:hypothetical protein
VPPRSCGITLLPAKPKSTFDKPSVRGGTSLGDDHRFGHVHPEFRSPKVSKGQLPCSCFDTSARTIMVWPKQ